MTTTPRTPTGLGNRGRRLWRDLHALTDFDPAQTVLVEEACRIADRLDRLDALLRGDEDTWFRLRPSGDETEFVIYVDSALSEARQQQNVLKQLLVTLRLPDADTGKKPQRRGARGAYKPTGAVAGNVSSLERARAARSG